MVGYKGREGCGLEREAESKSHGTANLFTHIPSGHEVRWQEVISAKNLL